MSEENTTVIPPATTPPAPAAVTVEHISALHRHLDDIGHAVKVGFEALFRFVRKEAPAVEAGAPAVATAIPGVAPVAAAVETAAGAALAVVECTKAHGFPLCADQSCPNVGKPTPSKP